MNGFSTTLQLQNHWKPLMDSSTKEPFPMKLIGDFQVPDPIFKGCYEDSLLYSDENMCQLRWQWIHPTHQKEIPVLPAPLYW